MSPLPRRGRQVSVLLLVSIVSLVAFLATMGAPVGAQDTNETGGDGGGAGEGAGENQTGGDGAEGGATVRRLLVSAQESGCPEGADPCWDVTLFAVKPGEQVAFTASFEGATQPHDLQVQLPAGSEKVPPGAPALGGVHTLEFETPEEIPEAGIPFICTVHPTTMVGSLVTPAVIAAGAAHAESVPQLGVNFLAYWVGVIAFAILFVVYGLTFFLFKYNETPATTDHWDRAGDEGARRFSPGATSILALVIAAVVIGGVVYLAGL